MSLFSNPNRTFIWHDYIITPDDVVITHWTTKYENEQVQRTCTCSDIDSFPAIDGECYVSSKQIITTITRRIADRTSSEPLTVRLFNAEKDLKHVFDSASIKVETMESNVDLVLSGYICSHLFHYGKFEEDKVYNDFEVTELSGGDIYQIYKENVTYRIFYRSYDHHNDPVSVITVRINDGIFEILEHNDMWYRTKYYKRPGFTVLYDEERKTTCSGFIRPRLLRKSMTTVTKN